MQSTPISEMCAATKEGAPVSWKAVDKHQRLAVFRSTVGVEELVTGSVRDVSSARFERRVKPSLPAAVACSLPLKGRRFCWRSARARASQAARVWRMQSQEHIVLLQS